MLRRSGAAGLGGAAVAVVVVRVLGAVVQVLVLMAYARWFPMGDVGRYAVALAIWTFARQVGPIGGDQALLRGAAAVRKSNRPAAAALGRKAERRALRITAVPSALVLLVALAVPAADRWLMVLIALGVPIYALQGVYSAEMRGHERHMAAQIPESIALPVLQLGIAWMTRATVDDSGVLACLVAAFAVAVGLKCLSASVRGPIGELEVADHAEFLRVSRPAAIAQGVTAGAIKAPVILVAAWAGQEEAALFEVASRGLVAVAMITSSVGLVLSPQMAVAFRRGDRQVLQNLWALGSLAAGAPASVALIVGGFAGGAILQLFGSEYIAAWPALVVLLAAGTVNAFLGSSSTVLLMSDSQWSVAKTGLVQLVLVLVLASALIPAYGAIGAAICWLAATVVRESLLAWHASRQIGVSIVSAHASLVFRWSKG
jgi:O-antigen/teichoic acid export membrane protein